MRKTYTVKPVSEIELAFPEKTVLLRFDAVAAMHASDFEGGISDLLNDESTSEKCAKIIYMGACEQEKGFTIEDARKIVAQLDILTLTGIFEDFVESLRLEELLGEEQKKTMEEMLKSIAK